MLPCKPHARSSCTAGIRLHNFQELRPKSCSIATGLQGRIWRFTLPWRGYILPINRCVIRTKAQGAVHYAKWESGCRCNKTGSVLGPSIYQFTDCLGLYLVVGSLRRRLRSAYCRSASVGSTTHRPATVATSLGRIGLSRADHNLAGTDHAVVHLKTGQGDMGDRSRSMCLTRHL